jgi:two-component system chemotaxis response regulator CheB
MVEADATKLRVLVVDDSAYNRQTIADILEALPDVKVAGRAVDGRDALRLAFDLKPDVITLDLEMPEMDGFAFLRVLMSRRPTPVIVVSGYADHDNVFKALELGALDFIAKPARIVTPELKAIGDELSQKIALVRRLQVVRLRDRAQSLAEQREDAEPEPEPELPPAQDDSVVGIVGIAASTGGPPAVHQLLTALPGPLPVAILVAQHMPASFTRAFASRLDRAVAAEVFEARDGDLVRPGVVYVAPGACNVAVEAVPGEPTCLLRVWTPNRPRVSGTASLTPSADVMFESMVATFGRRMCAIVMTGMGTDGTRGAQEASEAGGYVLVEDPATAVMPGMPQSVVDAGVADEVLRLEEVPAAVLRFVERCEKQT